MADDIDKANDLAEMERAQAVYDAMKVTGSEHLTGYCHWCKEPARGIVCSRECRDDMNKAERMKG